MDVAKKKRLYPEYNLFFFGMGYELKISGVIPG